MSDKITTDYKYKLSYKDENDETIEEFYDGDDNYSGLHNMLSFIKHNLYKYDFNVYQRYNQEDWEEVNIYKLLRNSISDGKADTYIKLFDEPMKNLEREMKSYASYISSKIANIKATDFDIKLNLKETFDLHETFSIVIKSFEKNETTYFMGLSDITSFDINTIEYINRIENKTLHNETKGKSTILFYMLWDVMKTVAYTKREHINNIKNKPFKEIEGINYENMYMPMPF